MRRTLRCGTQMTALHLSLTLLLLLLHSCCTCRLQFMMVSFTRGDAEDPAVRHSVLSGYQPESTTVYNTSAALLKVGARRWVATPECRCGLHCAGLDAANGPNSF